jgi:hypothetical protein
MARRRKCRLLIAYRYSLEVQYELPYQLVATLGYQGSAGRHFLRLVNQNFVFARQIPTSMRRTLRVT